MGTIRRILGGGLVAALSLLRANSAAAVAFQVTTSTTAPCFTSSLCVEVDAELSGSAVFGSNAYSIPLPVPDPAAWIPVEGRIDFTGGIGIRGTYPTDLVRARETPPFPALMGTFSENLSFYDAEAILVASAGAFQTMPCGPVPIGYAQPTVLCGDGNAGFGGRTFGPGELGWADGPLDLALEFASTTPLPIQGTESFQLFQQRISIGVVYIPAPAPASASLQIVSSGSAACDGTFLCARVLAVLSGTADLGTGSLGIPLPVPSGSTWRPISATIDFHASMGIRGSYPTAEVRARESGGNGAIMGVFGESLDFFGSDGELLASPGIVQTMLCGVVPAGYLEPAFPCGDGNGGGGSRHFGPGELAWTQAPLDLSVDFSSTAPLPIPGTARFELHDQPIEILVKYSTDADGDGVANASDNCPGTPNPGQQDRGGVGSTQPDGIGDACQCGDVNGNGSVTIADAALILRSRLLPPTASLARPELCDVGGSPGCSAGDAAIVQRALLSPPRATIDDRCASERL